MRYVLGAIDHVRDGYLSIVRRLVRVALFGLVAVAVVAVARTRAQSVDTVEPVPRDGRSFDNVAAQRAR
jgi:hypothetical protein